MKRNLKKVISLVLAVLMVSTSLVFSPIVANADTAISLESTLLDFWADPENTLTQADVDHFASGSTTTMVGGVAVHKRTSSSNYYLFLPSSTDCTNLKLWFTASSCTVDGTSVTNGVATDVFKDIDTAGTSKTYTIKLGSSSYTVVAMKSSDVGAVYIDTTSGSLSTITSSDHDTEEAGYVLVVDENGKIEYDGVMDKMTGRGNGTWDTSNAKNPYNFNLNRATSLLGMSKSRKWTLLANVNDATLIKNQLTYDFAKYIGVSNQVVCKPVDLYVNQQYLGSYQLAERVEIRSSRVDVTDAYENLEIANNTADLTGTSVSSATSSGSSTSGSSNTFAMTIGNRNWSTSLTDPADVTGGYIYEIEISQRWMEENAGFCAYNRQGWVIKSCDYASQGMVNYSYDLLYALGGSVYNKGVVPSSSVTTNCSSLSGTFLYGAKSVTNSAPATEYQGMTWDELLDADSAALYYWTQEYFKNMDSSTSSTYFVKDSDSIDGKLYAGPVWDMDNSICYDSSASRWGYSYTSSDGWYTKNARIYRWRTGDSKMTYSSDSYSPLNFYAALATNCSDFWELAENKWHSIVEPATQILLGTATDSTGTLKSTEYYTSTIKNSATMNLVRHGTDSTYADSTISSDINSWFTSRNSFIDGEIGLVDISNTTITVANQICNGSPLEPKPTITYNDVTLVEGEDYQITSYQNNTNAGTATITIEGIGKFTNSTSKTFTISTGALTGGKAVIPAAAYVGDELTVAAYNANGIEITDFITYQWKRNGSSISGATAVDYVVTSSDVGATITCEVLGDGKNISTLSITSNDCTVREGDRPVGFTQTIAAWDYDYDTNKDLLASQSATDYIYGATSGVNQTVSTIVGSVDATNNAQIDWSGESDIYANGNHSSQAPVMSTSKTDSIAWGQYPYYQIVTSTDKYENIMLSAKLGGTNKAPRDWKVQYSTDGTTFTDVSSAAYSITNNKTLESAFDMIQLPDACNDQEVLYIRIVATSDTAIDGASAIVNQLSGDSAINNVAVYGSSTNAVATLSAPTISTNVNRDDTLSMFSNEKIVIEDTNGGADIYYTIDTGDAVLYTGKFNPFGANAKIGDTATVNAYASFDGVVSPVSTVTVTNLGTTLTKYNYNNYTENIVNGVLSSNGGVYDESGKLTNVLDGTSMVVPMYSADNNALVLAPSDDMKWTSDSGFYFEINTKGYQNITFTAKAYTTTFGPSSISLQYSTNGTTWTSVSTNVELNANGELEQVFVSTSIPNLANLDKAYIRLVTTQDKTEGDLEYPSTTLFNNNTKGNLYVNDVIIAGEPSGDATMPYTNKATNYFGANGVLKYHSPNGATMQYSVTYNGNVIASGEYPESTGIQLSAIPGFDAYTTEPYTVSVWSDSSVVNTRDYYYKGSTVVAFDYNSSSFSSADGYTVASNSGTNSGTLSMSANGTTQSPISYSGTYGVKTEWISDNKFESTSTVNTVGGGYWLISTSTVGFNGVTLSLEQVSSNKGPRDWALAYSTDGSTYTFIEDSNVRAVSNDYIGDTVQTYSNFKLPTACDNQEQLFIKVFINGNESVSGDLLADCVKGNTGINNIELSGIGEKPPVVDYTFTLNTVAMENKTTAGTTAIDASVTINGVAYSMTNGTVSVTFEQGTAINVVASANGTTFVQTYSTELNADTTYTMALVAVDMVPDGVINVKDLAEINRSVTDSTLKAYYKSIFNGFLGLKDA